MGTGGGAVGVCPAHPRIKKMINTSKIYKMRIVFRMDVLKAENRNVFNAVRKMVLASGLPVEPAKVNKNWPRLSYGPAPAQGQWAEREYLDIYLQESVPVADVKQRLEAVAPEGLCLLSIQRVPYPLPSVQNLAAAARYRVQGDFTSLNVSGRKWEEFIGTGRMLVSLRAENGIIITLDAAPYLVDFHWQASDDFCCTLQRVQDKWLRPEWLIAAWLGIEIPAEEEPFTLAALQFTRQCLLWRDSQGELHPI